MSSAISSLGSVLRCDVASVLTVVAGVLNFEFKVPEVELTEGDDITDTYLDEIPTGRTGGASCSFEKFADPASATHAVFLAQANSPAAIDWQVELSDSGSTTQDFTGVLQTRSIKADKGSALMESGEIKVTSAPTMTI